ncbi:mucin-17-like [Acropora millepora]|uniref:mucin-17-like n=1 Tax=Acropora millepora TaxID=45264 RepID=UPI001CF2DD07|nr:mucin-17-like [Acropora millepora]
MTDFSFRSSTPPGSEFVFEPSVSPSSSKDTGTSVGKSATPSAAKTIDNNKQQSDNSTATQGTKSEEIADNQPSESCAQTRVEGKDSAEHQESNEETLRKSVEDAEQQREVATDGNKPAQSPFGALFKPNVKTDFSFRSSTLPGSEFVFEPSASPSSSKDTGTSVGKSATPSAAKTIDNNKEQSDNSTATPGTKSEEIVVNQPSESCAQTTVEGKDSAEYQESNEETLRNSVEDVEQQREVATDGNKPAQSPFGALFGPNVMTDFSFRPSTPPGSEFVFEPSASPSSSKDTGTSVGKSATPSAAKTIDNNKEQSDNSTATPGTKSEEIVDNQPSESCAQTTVEGKDSAEHQESNEETLRKSVEDAEQQREVATDGNKRAQSPFEALFGPNVMTDFSFRSSTPPGSEFVFEPSASPSSSKDTGTSVGKSATPSAAKTIDNNKQQSDNSTATQGTKSEEIADNQPSESCAQTTVEGKDSAEHQESNEETLRNSVEDVEQQREVATDGNKRARAPFGVDKALFGPNVMTDFSFRSSTPPGSEFVFEPSVSPSSSKDTGTSVGKSATPSVPQPGALPFPALFTLGTGEGFTDGKETLSQFSRPSQDSPVAPSGLSSPLASSGVSLMESDEVTRSAEMNQSDTNNELRDEEHCDVDQKESVVQEDPAVSVRSGASGPSKEKE